MILAIVASVLHIVSSAPPMSPQEAVRILRTSQSPQDLTDFRACGAECDRPHPSIVVAPTAPHHEEPKVVFRPLNCCSVYNTPLPHPVVEVEVRRQK